MRKQAMDTLYRLDLDKLFDFYLGTSIENLDNGENYIYGYLVVDERITKMFHNLVQSRLRKGTNSSSDLPDGYSIWLDGGPKFYPQHVFLNTEMCDVFSFIPDEHADFRKYEKGLSDINALDFPIIRSLPASFRIFTTFGNLMWIHDYAGLDIHHDREDRHVIINNGIFYKSTTRKNAFLPENKTRRTILEKITRMLPLPRETKQIAEK